MPGDNQITRILKRLRDGEPNAAAELAPLVYQQMKRMAAAQLRREHNANSLQPTALVNEAYMRLIVGQSGDWKDRAHFFAVASHTLRHILVDRAKARAAQKRGGGMQRVEFNDEILQYSDEKSDDLLLLNAALDRLFSASPRASKIVEMRFFGGMTDEEIAESLGVSTRTVKRDWRMARAWLRGELAP